MCKTAKKFENSGQLGHQLKNIRPHQFPDAVVHMNRLLSSLNISPTTLGLAILLVATLATVENFPSVENSTMSSCVTMTKKRMKLVSRSTSASSGGVIPKFVEWLDPMCCASLPCSC